MGLRSAIERLIGIITSTTPPTNEDIPFSVQQGEVLPMSLVTTVVSRLFAIRVSTLPSDDGEAGAINTRLRVDLELRILYGPWSGGILEKELMASEDMAELYQSLRDPAAWDMPATGIVSLIWSEDEPTVDVGATVHHGIVSIPLTLLYREA